MSSPKSYIEAPISQHHGIRGCLWQVLGGAVVKGISALSKRDERGVISLSALRGHNEKIAVYEPERKLSPDTRSDSALILDSPASVTMRNKCLFLSFPIYYSLVIAA